MKKDEKLKYKGSGNPYRGLERFIIDLKALREYLTETIDYAEKILERMEP